MYETYEAVLCHHGIMGMKWGVRRYQNPDGSLTKAGELRYYKDNNGNYKKYSKKQIKKNIENSREKAIKQLEKDSVDNWKKSNSKDYKLYQEYKKKNPKANLAALYSNNDFNNFLAKKGIDSWEWEGPEIGGKATVLGKNYVKDQMLITGVMSTLLVAPFSSAAVYAATQSGKAAATTALGAIGGMSLYAAIESNSEKKKVEKEFGLR